ncbi:MAG: MBL fold metallo-hydrolase [Verrucomicrobia bacterium]|nr:MBL fold metallo-hydrolase [Verrucomicrobiota bacterium]
MEIRCYTLPPIGTNSYLLIPPESEGAILVDAPLNSFATVEKVLVQTGRKLSALLLTHGHWDHTLDGWRFNQAGIPVYAHRGDDLLLSQPEAMSAFSIPGLKMQPVHVDHWVKGDDRIAIAGMDWEVRAVPGHSPGSVLFWCEQAQLAFVGDALFAGSVGRTDLPGGDFAELETSIRTQIYTLPPATRVFPGHGPETSVGTEMQSNPYVHA